MAIALTFIVSLGLSALLASTRGHWQVLDIPNERSLHSQPTPRTGGIAILAGLVTGGLVAWWQVAQALVMWPVIVAVTLLAAIAQLDDRHTLGPVPRLAIQLGVVALVLTTGTANTFPPVTLFIAGLFLVWMINLYNFMDGMDGFAG